MFGNLRGKIGRFAGRRPWSCAIFLLGIGWSLYLQTLIQDEVFYSGDGGLKTLLVRQFARGDFDVGLNLESAPWVQSLWDEGFYPFDPPFVYERSNRREVAFHFLFPFINAPLFALFGYRGLYLIPLLAVWGTWLLFIRLCRATDLSDVCGAAGLAVLIFATPLTLYSAMFWEHTLAVLLATGGTVALLEGGVHSRPRRNLIVAGVALGLAIWFRPESYVFAGACAAAFPILARSPDRRRRLLYFMSALVVTVVIHWAINYAVYRHPFGIQSLQVLESAPASQYQTDYASLFKIVADLLYDYMRPSLFCLIAAPIALAMTRKTEATRRIGFLFVVSLVFFFAVPLILPNYGGKQWGPRFYLLFMPLISVQIAWALGVMVGRDMIWQAIGLSSFAYCLLAGGRINAYDGTRALASDYADRILPSLRFLRESNHKTILVARQWIPMELQAALPDKQFFRLARWERLEEVVPVLLDHGRESFLVVLDRDDAFPKNGNFMSAGRRVEIRFRSLGILGAYEILEGVASNAE